MRIIVYLGTGGVGKTSVAAATALALARSGTKSLVLTIDPARRLRTALRLHEGSLGEKISLTPPASGELWAELLDVRATLDEAVRLHSTADLAKRILEHPIYAAIASSLAGMQELMALERVYQLMDRGFENIVIDTAPSRHALEFLDKPAFFAALADSHWVKLVGRTYRIVEATGMLSLGRKTVDLYARVEAILGASLVRQVLDFYALFVSNAEGYAHRAQRTIALLRDPAMTEFRVVTLPQKALRDVRYFDAQLTDRKFSVGTFYVNRVWAPDAGGLKLEGLAQAVLSWYNSIHASHQEVIGQLREEYRDRVRCLSELARDVDGMDALELIARQLSERTG
jgi:anion-transporting  ArsA/GET3 family ATPase